MKNLSKIDMPREKMKAKGSEALTDLELLQALIGSGNAQADVKKIARRLHVVLKENTEVDYEKLVQVSGLGPARISEILVALELGKRFYAAKDQPIIDSPEKAVLELSEFRDKQQEHFVCLTLDGANRLINKYII